MSKQRPSSQKLDKKKSSWQSKASLLTIKKRARMLNDIRAFFDERDVLEVETPLLSAFCTTDPTLNSFKTQYQGENYYLNTSPEYAMKRLLAEHKLAIFQICKSFRLDELGPNHNPEFTMLEWYRPGFSLSELMDELEQLLAVLVNKTVNVQRLSYQALFEKHAGFNPHLTNAKQCRECAQKYNLEQPLGMGNDVYEWLDWLLTQLVLPNLAKDKFVYVYDYPKSQCALAKLRQNELGLTVASRFELFYGEIELANGFDELTDAQEQKNRFHAENDKRKQIKYEVVDVDGNFLAALEHGLPDCSGVAVGLDRLLMLLLNENNLSAVFSYPWRNC